MDILKKKLLRVIVLLILILVMLIEASTFVPVSDVSKTPETETPNVDEFAVPGFGVVADDSRAVDIGMDVLQKGGSAVDAAIAISYAMGVVLPVATGLGGSGIMLVYPGDGTTPVVYDYMGSASENISGKSAVPGFVKGMVAAHNDFGKLDMAELLEPSIKLAKDGSPVSALLSTLTNNSGFRISSSLRSTFFNNGKAIAKDEILKQPDLAKALEIIKNNYIDFYEGEVAKEIVKNSNLTLKDLAGYQVVKREPIKGIFSGYEVYSSTPPSGGVTLVQTLSLAEKLKLGNIKENSANYISLLAAITQVTYNDRLGNIGDPSFYDFDDNILTSDDYVNNLASQVKLIDSFNQLPVDDSPAIVEDEENTTHIVVYDKNGMMVSLTNTLTQFFGTGESAFGFFINNHMDNFSLNSKSINAVEEGKRPRSYIAPTILVKDEKPVIGIGSPGGMRIPLMLTQVMIRFLENKEPLQAAINAPRFFYNENKLYIEKNYLSELEMDKLRKDGVSVILNNSQQFYGSVNALYIDYENKEIKGGADPRRNGTWEWIGN
ncbi:MAG: gamma-glutamyltranspeptidase [Fusobacteria bacterium]|nr:MAG: gamma-glutamyltranspeptidase [Fusobacteriota bacterium]KAF0228770.1 MAG: hypothetical protein FD182_1026 [Fusobacteriota bacterium]